MSFQAEMAQVIRRGLVRKAVTNCGKWTRTYRMIQHKVTKNVEPFDFSYYPWLWEMHNTEAHENIGQKAAQMGFTEWGINTMFYGIDIRKISCLYVLPTEGEASDFTASRFDPALEASNHLRRIFSDVRNVGHKRAGQVNLFVRGSRSKSKLKSLPVGLVIFDEVAEMTQENIPQALERTSGQMEHWAYFISTPTIENKNINVRHKESTKEWYIFECPKCSKWTELVYPECFVLIGDSLLDPKLKESHLICKECKGKLPHETKPEWLKNVDFGGSGQFKAMQKSEKRGFGVSQLYSCTKKPGEIAELIIKMQHDPAIEQEFYNSTLGIPHLVDGAQITDTMLENCKGGYYKQKQARLFPVTMGVDVGKVLHVEIDEWILPNIYGVDINDGAKCRILTELVVKDFEELDGLMKQFQVNFCVIDRHPETRKAKEFANRFWGHVRLCMYSRGIDGKQIQMGTEDELTVKVDRTSWLDLSLGRFKSRDRIMVPVDLSMEYLDHLKEPKRVYRKDTDGNPIGYYENTGPDHFAHARNYAEIALQFVAAGGGSQDFNF